MNKDKLLECGTCHKKYLSKKIKRIRNEWKCKECIKEWRKENREFLKRKILGIRKKSDLLKEWKEKREQINNLPKINGAKVKGTKIGRKQVHLYITSAEKQVLYKKYISEGLDFEMANIKVKETCENVVNLIELWKNKSFTDEEINRRFREEFAKLLMI